MRPQSPLLLAILPAVLLASPARADQARAREVDAVARRFAAEGHVRLELELPRAPRHAFDVRLRHGGRELHVVLEPKDLRARGFRVRTSDAAGRLTDVAPPPASAVTGRLRGDETALVAGSLGPRGLFLRVVPAEGPGLWVRPLSEALPDAARSAHVVFSDDDLLPGAPDAGFVAPDGGGVVPRDVRAVADAPAPARAKSAAVGMRLAEIAFDVDNPYHVNHGSDLAATIANVEGHLAVVDAHYARDVMITYELTEIIVRTEPFYFPDAMTGLLDLFRLQWNANHADVTRDMTHLMTGQPAPGLAGLAYVSVTCNVAWAYGWSVDSSGVLSHELGHNWSSGHCHDTSPCNNMCGACLWIGPNTKDIILAFRDSRDCLDDPGPYADPTEPYAHPDHVVIDREPAALRAAFTVDVLANDHDANCEELAITGYDARTELGGTVSVSPGSGPGGRDELAYVPPCSLFSGEDRFTYEVGDGTGFSASTFVTVDVRDRPVGAFWTFDEGVGSVAADLSGRGRDATLRGGAGWTPGLRGSALLVDGVDGDATVPGLALAGDEATIATWLRRDGAQAPWAGLVFTRAGGAVGFNLGEAHELRYHWGDGANNWGWDSGLVVPDGTWVFAALVVRPDGATVYLHDGTLRQAENLIPHRRQPFAGETVIGQDPTGGRVFRGALDEVLVLGHALTAEEVRRLAEGGLGAAAPFPADGELLGDPAATLSWLPAAGAESHDVYFGTDHLLVRDAGVGSPEFRGNQVGATWTPPDVLAADRTYSWRVDTHVGGVVTRGDTWLFEVASSPGGPAAWWRLDEGAGDVALDATGLGSDGTLVGGPARVTGRLSGALSFDGVDDRVQAGPVAFTGDSASITAWIRRQGDQNAWAGLVFNREPGSAAGFNFGEANELRYHWRNGAASWGWNTGLVVPDGAWVLAALVVEPDRATIALHDGTLQQAVNTVGHAPPRFPADTLLGVDPNGGPRFFRGDLDDVRVWDRALTAAEIGELWVTGGPAESPDPPDGALLTGAPAELSWLAGPVRDAHDVYLGTDRGAVAAATPASPEYVGTPTASRLDWTRPLISGTTYYWRVDGRAGPTTVTGRTWRFALTRTVGPSLRVLKDVAGRPELTWLELGGHAVYDVLRCRADAGPCLPTPAVTVGPRESSHVDVGADADPLVWYRIAERGGCD